MPASKLFRQVFLRPDTYHVGGGRFLEITADDIRASVEATRRLLRDGNAVPVLLEHADLGSPEGAPRANKARQVRHGVGWLKNVSVGSDGTATHVLEITDSEAARKIAEGSIRFTSPEFRPLWIDGKGRHYENPITHIALTHKPRAAGQPPLAAETAGAGTIEEAYQFSLADAVKMPTKTKPTPKPKAKQPAAKPRRFGRVIRFADDAPPADKGEPSDPLAAKLKQVKELLASDGMELPGDPADAESFVDQLIGLLTAKQAAAAPVEPEPVEPITEEPIVAESLPDNPLQMADDTLPPTDPPAEGGEPTAPDTSDAPPDDAAGEKARAIVANLIELGVSLPEDFDMGSEGAVDIMLAALKTAVLAKRDSATKPADETMAVSESQPPVQFSLADIANKRFDKTLLGRVLRRERDDLERRIGELVKRNRVTSDVGARLKNLLGTVQFSAAAEELPGCRFGDVVAMLESLPEGIQLSSLVSVEHHDGDRFLRGSDEPTPEEADTIVNHMFRGRNGQGDKR